MSEAAIVALIATIVGSGGIGAAITAWVTNRGTPENKLIDQLQEVVDQQRAINAEQRESVEAAQRREASFLNYIWELQGHINSAKPPPPPSWPDDLITR